MYSETLRERETLQREQRHCPKHVEFRTIINLEISASVGFIVKKFDTMHGHMNIKNKQQFFGFR